LVWHRLRGDFVPDEKLSAGEQRRTLADGNTIPVLGLGVWQVPEGPECEQTVAWALEAGYRHIDTAQAYGNEASVGRALHASAISREEVFITTKFYPQRRDPVKEIEKSLDRLGVGHVDLYIIHWPQRGATWAWPGMEAARERGHARSIGVSNFSAAELEQLLAIAATPPVINQVQFSPFEHRRALHDACHARGVAVEAYSPLGTGRHLADPPSPRSRTEPVARRRRSCCAGACSATRSCCPSPRTASASTRTPPSLTSPCPRPTWRPSTRSTPPARPPKPANAPGGDRPA
jgi:diketogulonate reductase-like aldo/keto reductase